MTGTTGLRLGAGLRASGMTATTFHMCRYPDLDSSSPDRLFQVQLQGIAQVTAPVGPGASATAEDIAEHVAEDIAETGTTAKAAASARSRRVSPGMSELVIGGPSIGVGQHLVGFGGFFELLFGLFISRITVRVILHGKTPISLLNLFFVRRLWNTQYFVIIALSHSLSCHHQLPKSPLGYNGLPLRILAHRGTRNELCRSTL